MFSDRKYENTQIDYLKKSSLIYSKNDQVNKYIVFLFVFFAYLYKIHSLSDLRTKWHKCANKCDMDNVTKINKYNKCKTTE